MAGLLDALGSGLVKLGWWKMNFIPVKPVGEETPTVKEKEATAAGNQSMVRQRSGVSISEATIFMIMDRFAPRLRPTIFLLKWFLEVMIAAISKTIMILRPTIFLLKWFLEVMIAAISKTIMIGELPVSGPLTCNESEKQSLRSEQRPSFARIRELVGGEMVR